MSIKNIVENQLIMDDSTVWILKDHVDFGYTDGRESEKYIESVFKQAKDLSSGSIELESFIKDWASEYHLTTKRQQLFSGFEFNKSSIHHNQSLMTDD